MKTSLKIHLLLLALFSLSGFAYSQGTAFTYNGRLNNNGVPVNGAYELSFTLYDLDAGGNVVGGPLPPIAADVVNGLFTVRIDFGAGIFVGPPRWLNIEVRPVGDVAFTALTPRQEVTSSPYAIRAATAGTATDVANGSVVKSLNTLKDDVTLEAGENVTITPNGNILTLAAAGAGGSGIWSSLNNNAYYNAGNVGLGTSTPAHRLSLAGGLFPGWTANGWGGAVELANACAIGWRANFGGQHFGIGQSSGGLYFFHTLSDPGTAGSPAVYDMEITDAGHVLVGPPSTDFAGIPLQVNGALVVKTTGSGGNIQFATPNSESGMTISGANRADIRFDGASLKLVANGGTSIPSAANGITIDTAGTVGVGKHLDFGARLGQHINLWSGSVNRFFGIGIQDSTFYSRCGNGGADGFVWYRGGGHSDIYHNGGGGQLAMSLDQNGLYVSGPASVCTLTIRGGCDLAEPFAMKEPQVEKGSVVVIDEEHAGQLKLSTRAYDTRVAGIVSGANGINTGLALLQEGTLDAGQNVALTGRVYVQADASFGAIRSGDLLTTSDTPGHAMKVNDHARAQGAILGKAMSSLKEGRGMVLVLVTLQ